MELDLILKVAGLGLLVTAVCQVLNKSGRDEQAMLLSICAMIAVLLVIVGQLSELLRELGRVFGI